MKENYSDKFRQQVKYLNEYIIMIWCFGTLFTRFTTGIWFGDRPVFVLTTLLTLVYLYMHVGYYLTMFIRFPFVLLFLYLGHVHFIQPGDFFLTHASMLTWKHLLILWVSMNCSFLFHADEYPFKFGTLHWMPNTGKDVIFTNNKLSLAQGKIVPLPSRRSKSFMRNILSRKPEGNLTG